MGRVYNACVARRDKVGQGGKRKGGEGRGREGKGGRGVSLQSVSLEPFTPLSHPRSLTLFSALSLSARTRACLPPSSHSGLVLSDLKFSLSSPCAFHWDLVVVCGVQIMDLLRTRVTLDRETLRFLGVKGDHVPRAGGTGGEGEDRRG